MKEQKYAIYFMGASWKQDDLDYTNGTGHSRMYGVDPGIAAVRQKAIEWVEDLLEQPKYKNVNAQLVRLDCRFVEYETWCLNWFNHYTYNIHLTDRELLDSFEDFVERKQLQQLEGSNEVALMGADDYWRWEGPCRCDKCQKYGKTYIDH